MEVPLDREADQFPVFELLVKKRGRIWRWSVCTTEGAVVMDGSESSRPAAKYKAARALFLLLLSAPYQSIRLSRADDVRPHRRDASTSPTQAESGANTPSKTSESLPDRSMIERTRSFQFWPFESPPCNPARL